MINWFCVCVCCVCGVCVCVCLTMSVLPVRLYNFCILPSYTLYPVPLSVYFEVYTFNLKNSSICLNMFQVVVIIACRSRSACRDVFRWPIILTINFTYASIPKVLILVQNDLDMTHYWYAICETVYEFSIGIGMSWQEHLLYEHFNKMHKTLYQSNTRLPVACS